MEISETRANRALGHGVEDALWAATPERARQQKLRRLEVEYIATAKNAIVAELYDRLGPPRVRHNWDSLAMVQLITELERRFSVEFDLEEIHRLRSYAEIQETLSRKGLVFEHSATLPG